MSVASTSTARFGYIPAATYMTLPRVAAEFFEPVGPARVHFRKGDDGELTGVSYSDTYRVDVSAVLAVIVTAVLTVAFVIMVAPFVVGEVAGLRASFDATVSGIATGFDAWRHAVGSYLETATWGGMWADLQNWGIERVHDFGAFLNS